MKDIYLILLLNLVFSILGDAQSKTFEYVPQFQQSEDTYVSNPMDFEGSLDGLSFIGLSCYHLDQSFKSISYRLLIDKEWSDWKDFRPQHEVSVLKRAAYEADHLTSPFTQIQFKTTEKIDSELHVRFFLGQKTTTALPINQKAMPCQLPDFCARDCWCPSCPIDNTPQSTEPTHLIVHHSAGSNSSTDFAAVVEYIWDLHVNTNGWDDIGYNWLIDPNGVLYQGRPDGYQGAHFSCINENTVGICMLGDFTLIKPTNASQSTLIELLAFEATDHMIDITGMSYHETGEFILDNMAGHRDSAGSANSCSATACPGEMFYPLLGTIRTQVAEMPCYLGEISSIDDEAFSTTLVYPNPFRDAIYIDTEGDENSDLQIIDKNGQLIKTITADSHNDLSELSTGVYFVMKEGQVLQKIVKQ